MKRYNRQSIRLKGFDYSRPGEYFVTMVTAHRRWVFGEVVGGQMQLSEIGRIVESCWREIPEHFENTCVDVFQIMPTHVHGIVEIREAVSVVSWMIRMQSSGKEISTSTSSALISLIISSHNTSCSTPSSGSWIRNNPRVRGMLLNSRGVQLNAPTGILQTHLRGKARSHLSLPLFSSYISRRHHLFFICPNLQNISTSSPPVMPVTLF